MSRRYERGGQLDHYVPELDYLTSTQLWAALVCVTLGDLVTTLYGLRLGAIEANPVAAHAIAVHGPAFMVVLKGLFLGIWWVGLRSIPRRYELLALHLGVCYFGLIVVLNTATIAQLLGL